MTERATGAIVSDEDQQAIIDRLRARIDETDDEIIALLRKRHLDSMNIRRRKQRLGKPAVDLSREKDIKIKYIMALGAMGSEVASAVLSYSKDDE